MDHCNLLNRCLGEAIPIIAADDAVDWFSIITPFSAAAEPAGAVDTWRYRDETKLSDVPSEDDTPWHAERFGGGRGGGAGGGGGGGGTASSVDLIVVTPKCRTSPSGSPEGVEFRSKSTAAIASLPEAVSSIENLIYFQL